MTRHRRISAIATVLATAAVLVVSACSSSPDSASPAAGSSSGSGTSASAAVSAAEALVRQYTAAQPALSVAPLKSKPPAGKKVAIITCDFPSCQIPAQGATAAAKRLGWIAKTYVAEGTVEGYPAAWNQVLQTRPDLIIYVAILPNSVIARQLAEAGKLHILAVALTSNDHPNSVMRATISGSATGTLVGKLEGAAVVADAKGAASVLWVWDPASAFGFGPIKNSFTHEVTAAGGSVSVLNISSNNVGTTVPGQVVSYLQAHPDIKYLDFEVAAFLPGVPQALKAARLSAVKILSYSPSEPDLAALKSGGEWVDIAQEDFLTGYRAIDALARIVEGMPFDANPAGDAQILTAHNVRNSIEPAIQGNPVQAFLTAWHVG
jgi:hypothetical protein